MRFVTAVVLGCVAPISLTFWAASSRPSCSLSTAQSRPCSAADHRADPIRIDDDEIQKVLERRGGAIVDRGDHTEMRTLLKGLRSKQCALELPDFTPAEESRSDMYNRLRDSVVVVSSIFMCGDCSNWHATIATGFAVAEDGVIVTNHHVADNPGKRTIVVMTSDGQVFPVRQILAANRSDDLAILKTDAVHLKPLPIAPTAEPVGNDIFVISHPDQRFYCYTSGVVSRYTRTEPFDRRTDVMTITADYARGSSGAPVLNSRGAVVGIVMSTDSIYYSENGREQRDLQMVFKECIPSDSLRRLIVD